MNSFGMFKKIAIQWIVLSTFRTTDPSIFILFHPIQGGSLGNGTAVYGRDDVDSVIVVCFDHGTKDIKELVKKHKAKSRKIMDTIEERLVFFRIISGRIMAL